jgi:hypothetical protein
MENIELKPIQNYYLFSDDEDDEEDDDKDEDEDEDKDKLTEKNNEYDYRIMRIINDNSIIEINDREFAKSIYNDIFNTDININIVNALIFFVDVQIRKNEFENIKNLILKKAKGDVVNFL